MQTVFHEDLRGLSGSVVEMGELAIDLLRCAMDAISTCEAEKAKQVLEKRKIITTMDNDIEEDALRLLLLYQPVARDLRRLAAILKIITYLERVGRYAGDVAKIALELGRESKITKIMSIPYMGELVVSMLEDSIRAFAEGDIAPIAEMSQRDDRVDHLRYAIFRECLAFMMEDPSVIEPCVNHIMAARYLERCGDHACKISEKVYYMVAGGRMEIR